MRRHPQHRSRSIVATTLVVASIAIASLVRPAPVAAQEADALRAKQATLAETLAKNAFGRPLAIEPDEASGNLKGDVHAIVAQPFAIGSPALQGVDHWCDVLMLHLNVKGCTWSRTADAPTLALAVGRKFDQPLERDEYLTMKRKEFARQKAAMAG